MDKANVHQVGRDSQALPLCPNRRTLQPPIDQRVGLFIHFPTLSRDVREEFNVRHHLRPMRWLILPFDQRVVSDCTGCDTATVPKFTPS